MKRPLRLEKQQATSMAAAADISFTSRASQHEHERHELQPREYTNHACCTNCVISTALAAILCRRRCDADRVVADFAFFPPSPPTYLLVKREDGSVSQLEWKYRDLERSSLFSRFRQLDGKDGRALCSPLRTSRKEVVPTFFFDYGRRGFCVIYFHANATDCGAMLPTYAAFSSRLGVSVLAVEYSGYGGSTGRPSVANTLADARAAYEEARRLGFDASRIILYGQSVGSGPACYLASRCQVAGVILHSPIASGIRSLTGGGCCSPIYIFKCLDPYNNLKELKRSQAPVFVIHGTADEEIPFQHGQMLHDVARTKYPPFWVHAAGHNNILEIAEDEYFAHIRDFLAFARNHQHELALRKASQPTKKKPKATLCEKCDKANCDDAARRKEEKDSAAAAAAARGHLTSAPSST